MRFVAEEDGHIAPSQSTVMFIFDDAQNPQPAAEGRTPLVAPPMPQAPWTESQSTVVLQPSKSVLRSLRIEYALRLAKLWIWAAPIIIGVLSAIVLLIHFFLR
jgi:hypothetical protein